MDSYSSAAGQPDPTRPHVSFRGRLRLFAYFVRHKTFLRRFNWIWDLARIPYHAVFDLLGGVPIVVGGDAVTINIPAKFSGADYEHYETQSIAKVVEWCRSHRDGLFVDIGCSHGIYSAAALAAGNSNLVALDSDMSSLKQAKLFTSHYRSECISLVWGLVERRHSSGWSLQEAIAQTQKRICLLDVPDEHRTTRYITLESDPERLIPRHSIDGLFADQKLRVPCCLKCDVEGAEYEVLLGAQAFIESTKPAILLSVHFDFPELPIPAIRSLLEERGYRIEKLPTDHEEHWWCTQG
jgi:FkbM family methyltransferase